MHTWEGTSILQLVVIASYILLISSRGCQMCNWGIQCSTHRALWGLVVIWLSWLTDRELVAQARDVLGLTLGRLFHLPLYFRLITSKFIYKAIYVATCALLVPLDQWKVWVSHSVWCQNVLPIVPIHCCCMNSAMKKTKAIIVIKSMHGLCYFLHHTWYLVCIGK